MEIYPKYEPWNTKMIVVLCKRLGVWGGLVLGSIGILGSLWGVIRGDSVIEIFYSVGEILLSIISAVVIIGVGVIGVNQLERFCERKGWLKP